MKDNAIAIKSTEFGKRTVKAYQYLLKIDETIMSKQFLRSGTAIGALVKEGEFAQSRADFINKMSIALKEANETLYWIDLLRHGEYFNEAIATSLIDEVKVLISLLVAIIKSSKGVE